MKSIFSIIRFINNPLSKENIAIGLILISQGKVYFKYSNEKLQLISRINSDSYKLLDFNLDKINDSIKKDNINDIEYLFKQEQSFSKEYLERLSIYNNGMIQFDKPVGINMDFDEIKFNDFFKRYIELNLNRSNDKVINQQFDNKIKKVFRSPLKDVIDIDIKLKNGQIPSLFFDYKLDGLGVNGVLYSVKSIDLNCEKQIDSIRKEISELESLNRRIDLFGKTEGYDENKNKHYLVIDPYIGNKPSYKKLYNILSEQKEGDYPYKIINTNELENVTSEIKHSNAKKFSEQFSLLFND